MENGSVTDSIKVGDIYEAKDGTKVRIEQKDGFLSISHLDDKERIMHPDDPRTQSDEHINLLGEIHKKWKHERSIDD